ncbi:hypothetical protein AKUG0420_01880 [Apilactobacillus kunkeei]|nr:hypothetical protein AKUG0420_01880 [Apilactobacillus kunkeei]
MPVVNQIEVHPYLSQKSMLKANEDEGIVTQAWSPMGRGATLNDDTIQEIAKAHGKSSAQIILRWHLQTVSQSFLSPALHKELPKMLICMILNYQTTK